MVGFICVQRSFVFHVGDGIKQWTMLQVCHVGLSSIPVQSPRRSMLFDAGSGELIVHTHTQSSK